MAVLSVVVLVTAIVLAATASVSAAARVSAAADAAALAAADTAAGFAVGDPCDRAATVAAANGADVTACSLDGLVATVACTDAGGLPVRAIAVAGPPDVRSAGADGGAA